MTGEAKLRNCSSVRPVKAVLLALGLLLAIPGLAQDSGDAGEPQPEPVDLFDSDVELDEDGWPTLHVALGVTYLDADGVFAARLPDQPPVTVIDFDRAGLDETDASYWFSANWRSSRNRWGAWFASWRYDVTGGRLWEDSLPIPGQPSIPASASVISDFDATWYILEATYSFWQTERLDAGIGFGLHTVDIATSLQARVDVGEEGIEAVQANLDTLAPLPNLLAYVHWRFHPRWRLTGRAGWFGLDYDEFSGSMTNAHLMLSFDLTPRVGLGAAWHFVSLDVDVEKKNYTQVYDIDFAGPMAFLRFSF
jgi:hypothetical protein